MVWVSDNETAEEIDLGNLDLQSALLDNIPWPYRYASQLANPFEDDPTVNEGSFTLDGIFGTVSDQATNPTTLGAWFEPGAYLGAVRASDDWTAGWAREL